MCNASFLCAQSECLFLFRSFGKHSSLWYIIEKTCLCLILAGKHLMKPLHFLAIKRKQLQIFSILPIPTTTAFVCSGAQTSIAQGIPLQYSVVTMFGGCYVILF